MLRDLELMGEFCLGKVRSPKLESGGISLKHATDGSLVDQLPRLPRECQPGFGLDSVIRVLLEFVLESDFGNPWDPYEAIEDVKLSLPGSAPLGILRALSNEQTHPHSGQDPCKIHAF